MIKTVLKWLAAALALVIAAVATVALLGTTLPEAHRATGVARIEAQPADVWRSITAFEESPGWRSDVDRVELLSGRQEGMLFREHGSNGGLTMRVERLEPPRRLVTRIADQSLPFGGSWTFEVEATSGGASQVRITEDGRIYNAFFRGMSRWVLGYTGTIERYLEDLARHHGQGRVEIETDWVHTEDSA